MFRCASMRATRYSDIERRRSGPRTSTTTSLAKPAKCRAAWPALLAPPTTYTVCSRQLTASWDAAP